VTREDEAQRKTSREGIGKIAPRRDRARSPGGWDVTLTRCATKLYFAEPGSAEFTRAVKGRDDLLVSDLSVTEVVSALSRRVRQGAVTPEDARRAQRAIIESLDAAPDQRVELTREVHRRAEQLLLTLMSTPLRAADGLHLALALSARALSMASFDMRLAAPARAVGLAVYPA
jgi:predicted nucleic acid-binding protein